MAVMAITVIKVSLYIREHEIRSWVADTGIQAYPLAFIEFIEEEDGSKRREGPRSENDEARVSDKWKVGYAFHLPKVNGSLMVKVRREVEGSKLRAEHDKKMNVLEGYADRLERRAGPRFCPAKDGILVCPFPHHPS